MEIYFILVEPAVPENIGASARAIKTMSFSKLRLVNPCDYLSKEARKLAHGSHDVLAAAEVFQSLEGATGDLDFIIGTSAKNRRVRHDYVQAGNLVEVIRGKGSMIRSAGIVFGREEYGLSNEEAADCDILCTIPMAGKYPSLNLSQAVMILAYELSSLHREEPVKGSDSPDPLTVISARKIVEESLTCIGVQRNRVLFNRIIERINLTGEDDLHLIYSVCKFFRETVTAK